MARASTPSLPGVSFIAPPVRRPLFPRLDVAAFVGYADRGPTDLAVAVEDARQYEAVFGGELPLARDDRGDVVTAHLPGAVRAFFANGGRRCHVVRVAGPRATPARFAVPGLVSVTTQGDPRLATVDASSVGRWANGALLAARLDALPLPPGAFSSSATGLLWRRGAPSGILLPGDLLRIRAASGASWIVNVRRATPSGVGQRDLWVDAPEARPLGVPAGGLPGPTRTVSLLTLAGQTPLGNAETIAEESGGSATRLVIELDPMASEPKPGDLLLIDPGSTAPAGSSSLLVEVRAANRVPLGSPPGGLLIEVDASQAVALEAGLPPVAAAGDLVRVERLRFELRLGTGDGEPLVLADLAFGAGSPRNWLDVVLPESVALPIAGRRPDDPAAVTAAFVRYRSGNKTRDQRVPTLDRSVLAGRLAPSPDPGGPTFIPVGMPGLLGDGDATGPVVLGTDDLLSHEAGPFIDSLLADVPPARLMSEALDLATIDELRLNGMHALMLVDEVALVAVPDAVQSPWEVRVAATPIPLPPVIPPAPPAACPEGDGFELCDRPPTVVAITPPSGFASISTPVVIEGTGFLPGPVEVLIDGQPADAVVVVRDDVLTCTTPGASSSPPHLSAGAADVVVRNPDGEATLSDGFIYVPDPVDPTLPVLLPATDSQVADPSTLLAIQGAQVRLARGRGDVVALLDLPARYRVPETIAWQAELRTALGQGDADLAAGLSYAAAYHPWLMVVPPDGALPPRPMPPSGAVAGIVATRELTRGAWIAPANDPLRGVRALEPDLTRDEWVELFANQVNVVRREADDFRPMSAHTLTDLGELRQISVRRLLILLRKAALEQGLDYVFETNHERFREGVAAMLGALLRRMHDAGAFAGSTPEQSYRVVTGASVNPPASVDQGRFVALVQVAPSQPAEFLTVELIRTGVGVLEVAGA